MTGPVLQVCLTPLSEASQNQARKKPKDSQNVESVLKNLGHWPKNTNVSKKTNQSKATTPSNSFICLLVSEQFVFTQHV